MKEYRKRLVLTFGTKKHGEVVVNRYVDAGFTTADAKALIAELLATYRTKKGIPLKEYRRGKFQQRSKTELC